MDNPSGVRYIRGSSKPDRENPGKPVPDRNKPGKPPVPGNRDIYKDRNMILRSGVSGRNIRDRNPNRTPNPNAEVCRHGFPVTTEYRSRPFTDRVTGEQRWTYRETRSRHQGCPDQ